MRIPELRPERSLVVLLLTGALMMPQVSRGSVRVSHQTDSIRVADLAAVVSAANPESGLAPILGSVTSDSPQENWAESEKDDSDGDDEHRCLPTPALNPVLQALTYRLQQPRALHLPSLSITPLRLRC